MAKMRAAMPLVPKINDVIALHCLQENDKPEPPQTTGGDNETTANTASQGNEDLSAASKKPCKHCRKAMKKQYNSSRQALLHLPRKITKEGS